MELAPDVSVVVNFYGVDMIYSNHESYEEHPMSVNASLIPRLHPVSPSPNVIVNNFPHIIPHG